jgi:hypothetical protein
MSHGLKTKNDLFAMVEQMKKEVTEWYAKRSKDEQIYFRSKVRSSK